MARTEQLPVELRDAAFKESLTAEMGAPAHNSR